MSRRFTTQELFALRNEIKITSLIEKYLSMPVERVNSRFRFACPICSCFETSINKEKNLARCFACNENFNTIDMVMRHMNLGFVPSVKFLKEYHKKNGGRNIMVENRENADTRRSFTAISEIIPKILPRLPKISSEKQVFGKDDDGVCRRIDELEKKIDLVNLKLDRLIKKLASK